jgi:bifunctional oligoribonuclease and PAP phosphatase NrnA
MKKETEAIKKLLSSPKKIFITTHHKPDGDAIGSSLALFHYLVLKGHEVSVIVPNDYADFLQWLPGNEVVINFETNTKLAVDKLESADLIFCNDFNALHRINELGKLIEKQDVPKIMIDHHLDPEPFASYVYWNADACATAELIFDFIEDMDDLSLLNKEIATAIYTGIVTDSGSFKYNSTTARVHHIAAALMACGIDHSMIHQNLFDNNSVNRLKFLGYCLDKKLVVLAEEKTAYMYISKDELEKYNIRTGETEGFVNYALSLKDIEFASLIIQRGDIIKMSFRSNRYFPANAFAAKYFSGGGHFNASGGISKLTLEKTVEKFTLSVKEFRESLTNE